MLHFTISLRNEGGTDVIKSHDFVYLSMLYDESSAALKCSSVSIAMF